MGCSAYLAQNQDYIAEKITDIVPLDWKRANAAACTAPLTERQENGDLVRIVAGIDSSEGSWVETETDVGEDELSPFDAQSEESDIDDSRSPRYNGIDDSTSSSSI